MAWILGLLKGFAVFGRLGWLFSWLPVSLAFLGPLGPILGAAVGFVGQIIGWALEGLTVIISKPVTLVTVALLATVAWGFGLDFGIKWDAGKVNAARSEVAAIKDSLRKQEEVDSKLATAAKKAREEAERKAVATPAAQPSATPVADPVAAPIRVQPRRATIPKHTGENVWGFPANFK